MKSHPGKRRKKSINIPIVLPRFSSTLAKLFALTSGLQKSTKGTSADKQAVTMFFCFFSVRLKGQMLTSKFITNSGMGIYCVRRMYSNHIEDAHFEWICPCYANK